MPEWKASVLAAEAEADAVQRGKGSEAGAAVASSFRERRAQLTGLRRVACLQSRAETSSDRTTAQKLAKREHITGDSAKKHTTRVVPTEARVAACRECGGSGGARGSAKLRHVIATISRFFCEGGPTRLHARLLATSAIGRVSTATRPITPRGA